MLIHEQYPPYAKASPEGPWNGIEDVAPDGLPRSPKGILKLAQQHGWGFGPITLVMRINHPRLGIPPFFLRWDYHIASGKWNFAESYDLERNRMNYPGVKLAIELASEMEQE